MTVILLPEIIYYEHHKAVIVEKRHNLTENVNIFSTSFLARKKYLLFHLQQSASLSVTHQK